jgi:choline kinase
VTLRKAIILGAGQGKRLLPLTAERPKCLVPVGGRTMLARQVDALAKNGIAEIVVVTGFAAAAVDGEIARLARPGLSLRALLNPFFGVADNLASCFLARPEMTADMLVLNGDTLFEPAVLARLLAEAGAPITVTIDRKAAYDADDMKVVDRGGRLQDIGKTLDVATVTGESIGMLAFRGEGPRLFAEAVERAMRTPEGLKAWYLSVIARLAPTGAVGVVSIEGLSWGEVDTPADLARVDALAARWDATPQGRAAAG